MEKGLFEKRLKLHIINGANLNLLGTREPEVYGSTSYSELEAFWTAEAERMNVELTIFQSNIEGELVNAVHFAEKNGADGIILNAGAYSHYSYALYDAVRAVKAPVLEVHLSNIYARSEPFRHTDVLSPACEGTISGLGIYGYSLAMEYFCKREINYGSN